MVWYVGGSIRHSQFSQTEDQNIAAVVESGYSNLQTAFLAMMGRSSWFWDWRYGTKVFSFEIVHVGKKS